MGVLATDNFTRADSPNLGANWSVNSHDGPLPIVSNQCGKAASSTGAEYYNAVVWPNDHYSQVVLKTLCDTSDEGMGPSVRMSASGDVYFALPSVFETQLYKVVGVSFTQIGSTVAACAANDVLYIEAQGTTVTVKKNGATIIGPSTDASLASGNASIWGSAAGAVATAVDDWEGGDFAASAAPPGVLDQIYARPMGVNQMAGPWGMVAEQLRALGSTVIASASTPTDLTSGMIRSGAVLPGATLAQSLALTGGGVRSGSRILAATLSQTQALGGSTRVLVRLPGASLVQSQALGGTTRSLARLPAASLVQSQALGGSIRSLERLTGASLTQSQPLVGRTRSMARLLGATLDVPIGFVPVALAGTTRSMSRLRGATLTMAQALSGSVRSLERLKGASLAQSQSMAGGSIRWSQRLLGAALGQARPLAGTLRALPRLYGDMDSAVLGSVTETETHLSPDSRRLGLGLLSRRVLASADSHRTLLTFDSRRTGLKPDQ